MDRLTDEEGHRVEKTMVPEWALGQDPALVLVLFYKEHHQLSHRLFSGELEPKKQPVSERSVFTAPTCSFFIKYLRRKIY